MPTVKEMFYERFKDFADKEVEEGGYMGSTQTGWCEGDMFPVVSEEKYGELLDEIDSFIAANFTPKAR